MSKNRIAAALCAAVMMGTSVPAMAALPMSVCAADTTKVTYLLLEKNQTDGDYTYNVYGTKDSKTGDILTRDYAIITKYAGTETKVTIPSELGENKVPVQQIKGAFSRNKTITSVVIPEGVTVLDQDAFSNCTVLTDVKLPETLTKTYYAFKDCKALSALKLPDALEEIGGHAFQGCSNLYDINFPANLKTIGANAFAKTAVKKAELPLYVTSVGNNAFYKCPFLTEVVLDTEVTTVGQYAFSLCEKLEKVTVKNPECKLGSPNSTTNNVFSNTKNGSSEYFTGTIAGYPGSTAEAWVERYNKSLNDNVSQATFEALEASDVKYELGDVDQSGKVDIMDVIAVNKYILGSKTLTKEQLALADVVGTADEVDSADSLTILKFALEMITEFPKQAVTK